METAKPKIKKFLLLLKHIPVTIALFFIILLAGVLTKTLWTSAPTADLLSQYGFGLPAFLEGNWLSIIAGFVFMVQPWMFLAAVVPLLLGAGFLEYRYGALKMLLALVITHCASVLLVALILQAGSLTGQDWALQLAGVRDVGFSNGAFGLLGVATATLGWYWRFRVRLGAILFCLVMILFSAEIWDLTHFVGLLVGILIGPLIIGRAYQPIKKSWQAVNARAFAASILVFYALSHLIIKISPGNGGLLQFGQEVNAHSIIFTTVLVFVALLFSHGLYHGRRVAWAIVLSLSSLLLLVGAVLFFYDPSLKHLFTVAQLLVLIFTLIVFRRSFKAKADPLTLKKLITRLLLIALLIVVLHIVILYGISASFSPRPSLGSLARESIYQIVGMTSGDFVPNNRAARFALDAINDVWAIFLVVTMGALVMTTQRDFNPANKNLYLSLLKKYGGSTLAWMGTWEGLDYFANDSKTAILAYHLSANVAIVLADPIGAPSTSDGLSKAFEEYCKTHGWTVAYFSSSASLAKVLKKQSYQAVHIADDTIIDLHKLEFSGKAWQSVRSSLNKAAKLGVKMQTIELQSAPLEILNQLSEIELSWLKDKALPEMGFTLGSLKEAFDSEVKVNIAIDEQGMVHGMTSWLPDYSQNGSITGWTLDIMQRKLSDQTMPGVMEFLIASSAQLFKQQGYAFISLSGTPLSGLENSKNLVERILNWASVKFEPYYGFSSLHKFKQKFQPNSVPMYLCYKNSDQLPNIAIAIGRAYMGDASLLKIAIATFKDFKK